MRDELGMMLYFEQTGITPRIRRSVRQYGAIVGGRSCTALAMCAAGGMTFLITRPQARRATLFYAA